MKLSYWNEVIKFGIDIDLLLCMLVIFECTNDNCYADSILRCEIILLSNQKELGHANWVLVENVIDYTVAAIYAMELGSVRGSIFGLKILTWFIHVEIFFLFMLWQ